MGDEKRVAVVTGANRGMGKETCRQLAERGLTVLLTSRDEAKGKEAVASLKRDGIEVAFFALDITDVSSVRALAQHLEQTYGRVDVLINNAGLFIDDTDSLDLKVDVLRRTLDANLYGAVHCSQALVPLMKKNGYGRIVNLSSGLGRLTDMNGGYPAYRISKAALNALTRVMSQDLEGTGIKVNAVDPGHVATDMGGANAPRTIEEGVDTTMWLATLRNDGPSGGFFRDCKLISW